ncbi:MAG: class I SAM-dependent methyltransferase, partial [Bacteroidia bacterium]|nr:class I SAM-dependent methyltransferase [Bacteroidia bacterium]
MNKQSISSLLRKLRILHLADRIRFYLQKAKNSKVNKAFRNNFPEVKLPPDYLIYESFQLNYHKYYVESRESARNLIALFQKHIDLNDKKILDWGCGPGRMIRHFPDLVGNGCEYYGTDYNPRSID